ncbi:Tenascin [Toxocara canis]|uniref:Tenascin n=1 Tax=Toxocara canis TaxID=6265 RepID=A0A0B2VS93_TOXCA|nr:Tenascin [Toxocara canis]
MSDAQCGITSVIVARPHSVHMPTQPAVLFVLLLVVSTSDASHRIQLPTVICENNGVAVNGRCECAEGFVGLHCEKKKHCRTWERLANGECVECESGWNGTFCEVLQCENGHNDVSQQKCICVKPYSGQRCNVLKTTDVYSFYNRKAVVYGPIGLMSVVPLLLILYCCERKARNLQVKRVESALTNQNITADRRKISSLLDTGKKSIFQSDVIH